MCGIVCRTGLADVKEDVGSRIEEVTNQNNAEIPDCDLLTLTPVSSADLWDSLEA
jgi:hypothetical protein